MVGAPTPLTLLQDKSEPKSWYKAEGLTIFPPESELKGTALDDLKSFFSADNLGKMFVAQ